MYTQITELMGKTLTNIVNNNDNELIFECSNGEKYRMFHNQDCCESVTIDDINGDLNDLLNSPILVAEELDNDGPELENKWGDVQQWTFYKLATKNGYVDIKWYGTSNGYYSTSVNFEEINK